LLYHFNNTKRFYGNDKQSIVKVINSIEGYEDKSITILEIKDFNNIRIVGFLSDNDPAYISFTKDNKGNYEWDRIEVRHNETLSSFLPALSNNRRSKFMFVMNLDNNIAKIEVNVNGQRLERKFTPRNAAVTWLDLPQTGKGGYTFKNYKYYDKDGNLVKTIN
jgi:hypothetical protein